MLGIRGLLLLFALIGLQACGDKPADHRQILYVFGTLLEITVYTDNTTAFQEVVNQLDLRFQEMHRDWHAWQGEGELVRLNRALAQDESLSVDRELAELLGMGKRYAQQSDGLFNPALGQLIGLWGFHQDEPPEGAPPAEDAIRGLIKAAPQMTDLIIEGSRISSSNRQVEIDLGAYAKGYALNLAIEKLKLAELPDAIVNAGGDLCAAGRHGDRPWRIGIRHPQGNGVIASLEVSGDECVLTSGNYERYREHDGIRYSHILDPRTGYPVEHVASVTVISPDGALADAAATALSVAGPDAWQRISRQMGVDEVMLVDGQGRVYLTPAMQSRVRFETQIPELIISEL